MKKVLLVIASIMMQVTTTPMAYGQTVLTESGIQTLEPAGLHGDGAQFGVFLPLSSDLWDDLDEPVFVVDYIDINNNVTFTTDEENINSQTGLGYVESEYMQPMTNYTAIAKVYDEDVPWIVYVSDVQMPVQFNSGPSARAEYELLGADTLEHRSVGPVKIKVTTQDFPGQDYFVQFRVCTDNQCGNYEYIGVMEHNTTDTFEFIMTGEPGDYVSVQMKVGNGNIGYVHPYWGTHLLQGTPAAVTVSVPVPNNGNEDELVAHGTITYGGYPTNQWFEVTGPEPVYGMMGPVNRLDYTGELTEVFDRPTTPGIYTLTHYADNEIGLNHVSVDFEILAPNGIEDEEFANGIMVYPIPSNGPVNITSAREASFTVTSVTGGLIQEGSLQAGKEEVLNLPSGIYMLSLYGDGVTAHRKLIVQ